MFQRLFKQKDGAQKRIDDTAWALYQASLMNTREEAFYITCGVPDTFDGRFDLLLVHLFVLIHKTMGEGAYDEVSQALFDTVFKDMDQTLREMGIGDMGVPKHMKRMMKAFNGRMHSYQMAIDSKVLDGKDIEGLQSGDLSEALARNLYGTVASNELDAKHVDRMVMFIHDNIRSLNARDVLSGQVTFENGGL